MCHPDQVSFPMRDGAPAQPVALATGSDRVLPGLWQPGESDGTPILLLTDVYGPTAFYQGLARDLAAHGCPTLIPDYLAPAGTLTLGTRDEALARGRVLDQRACLDDLGAAVDWLVHTAGLRGD